MSQKDERKQEVTPTASTTPPEKKTKTEEPLAHLPLPISNLLVLFQLFTLKYKKMKEYRNKKNKTSSVPPKKQQQQPNSRAN